MLRKRQLIKKRQKYKSNVINENDIVINKKNVN